MMTDNQKQDTIKTIINGKPVTLFFTQQLNNKAADFIKKALLDTYFAKAI